MHTNSPIQIGENIQLEVNAYWVHVYVKGQEVFKREPRNDDWLDWRHKAITDALDALEKAVKRAVTD